MASKLTSKSAIRKLTDEVRQLTTAVAAGGFQSLKPISVEHQQDTFVYKRDFALQKCHPSFEKIDLSFSNHQEAFKSKTNYELLRAILIFNVCSRDFIVKHQQALFAASERILGRTLFEKLLRLTIYGQFVAGADVEESKAIIERNGRYGVKSILDYSVEEDLSQHKTVNPIHAEDPSALAQFTTPVEDFGKNVISARTYAYEDEHHCDINMEHFLYCIDSVAHTTQSSGFAAVKVTALGRPELLMYISEIITRMEELYYKLCGSRDCSKLLNIDEFRNGLSRAGIKITKEDAAAWFNYIDEKGSGKIGMFQWCNFLNKNVSKIAELPSLKAHFEYIPASERIPLVPILEPDMKRQFDNMKSRLRKVAQHAKKAGVRIFIDAEQSYFQPAINHLTVEMMKCFNKDEPVVFNTYQAYTKKSLERLKIDMDICVREDLYFACKLVRGAYLDLERARAKEHNYEDPIWPTTYETTYNYVNIFEEILQSAKQRLKGKVSVMCATHNEESVRNAVLKMKELQISPDDKVVCFGQLMGMSDQISFTLGQAGFSVYKYVPYGPTFEVMPYLMRRAQENQGIFAKVLKERKMLRTELLRRLATGQLFYLP